MVTPLPPIGGDATEAPERTAPVLNEATSGVREQPVQVARNEGNVTPIGSSTGGLRYQYGRISRPQPGDRAAAERLFDRGVAAQSRGDLPSAATYFEAAAKSDPTFFAAHYNLGLTGYASGQWFKALSAFETALVLDPNSSQARYNFALTLQKARFVVDAAVELETLVAQYPNEARSRLLLGNVYAQDLGEPAEARIQYERVLSLEPEHPQAAAIRQWLSQHP